MLEQIEQRRLDEQVYQLTILQISNNLRIIEIIGYVQQAEHLTNLLSPVEKEVADKDEDIVLQIVDCYSKNVQLDREYETDEDELVPTLIKGKQALEAVQVLQLYEEQQVSGEGSVLCELGQLERTILEREMVSKKQTSITQWFS